MPATMCMSTFALSFTIVLAVIIQHLMIHAPAPKKGDRVTHRRYKVKMERLSTQRETYSTLLDEGVHDAANNLASSGSFVQSAPDTGLMKFLADSAEATASKWGQIVMYVKQQVYWSLQRHLGWNKYEAAGFVGLKTLYVASEAQLRAVLQDVIALDDDSSSSPNGRQQQQRTLLDIGAGTGTVTSKLTAVLGISDRRNVVCIENSESLRTVLSAQGFRVVSSPDELMLSDEINEDGDDAPPRLFSVAALFNVLDRCDYPKLLLKSAVSRIEPGGLLLVASVVPFRPLVLEGRRGSKWGEPSLRAPLSPLNIARIPTEVEYPQFEMRLAVILEAILRLHPELELRRWTRLPYVSSGDTKKTHYTLDMALMVFRISTSS
eukprot:jgi/Bigna1/75118/fgenesh1_pg.32_\